ncbi:acyl-CoA dehydrogenase [Streptomyces tubbatahanensis]|uniref:Acyl-CoA dehydrogenase n=1 Tax=Streptomyces tubbatahanensis TaxID=2923272 RepID=A0ABY3XKY3_9ACTN|nr:acyl-CoA dehydrogenase [Streptomyces tubbatahanensis]UNS95070.1 acyl-CoA dehydrogenase [Streptomyces tubbatahanensis]
MTGTAPAAVSAARLRDLLDRAARPGGTLDPEALAGLDKAEAFPEAAHRMLGEAGVPAHYIPRGHGGLLHGLDGLWSMLRVIAGHDLTLAVAHGKTFLGAVPTWVAGDAGQATALADAVMSGAEVCWGLTERGHGSDLLAGRLAARAHGDAWRLDGEKWPINNGTRARFACVLARTREAGGPRGFSFFLVDRETLPAGTCRTLPKELTHGVRGADISGFALRDAPVADDCRIGPEGSGLETALKSLQLTRIFATALSLGAADHALPLAVRFAAGRGLYGHRLADLPRIRRTLGEAAASILLAEAVAVFAGRAAQTLPRELGVLSAVTKAFVPTTVQRALDLLGDLLGVRGFVTTVFAHGAFAKLDRDHRIVSIFDGSTAVNRHALAHSFPLLTRAHRAGSHDTAGVAAAARHGVDRPALDPARLTLAGEGCGVVRAVPAMADLADGRGEAELARSARALAAESDRLHEEMESCRPTAGTIPAAAFDLAQRYELCVAGAVCLALWQHNTPPRGSGPWQGTLGARACLTTVLTRLGLRPPAGPDARDELATALLDTDPEAGRFSLLPVPEVS